MNAYTHSHKLFFLEKEKKPVGPFCATALCSLNKDFGKQEDVMKTEEMDTPATQGSESGVAQQPMT